MFKQFLFKQKKRKEKKTWNLCSISREKVFVIRKFQLLLVYIDVNKHACQTKTDSKLGRRKKKEKALEEGSPCPPGSRKSIGFHKLSARKIHFKLNPLPSDDDSLSGGLKRKFERK